MLFQRRLQHIASLLVTIFLLAVCLWILRISKTAHNGPTIAGSMRPSLDETPAPTVKPRTLSAQELMSRPLSTDQTKMPKLFHQSWKDSNLPVKFHAWSQSCHTVNADWEHVLWTDDDNAIMVEKYAPWFLDTFQSLPEPIERADASRNLYMYIFGGVYADLDTECLRSYNSLFARYNISTISHQSSFTNLLSSSEPQRKAFLGQMHKNKNYHSGLPNAWMASTPAHPFWILPLEFVSEHATETKTPEFLTGPDALFDIVKTYKKKYELESHMVLDKHLAESVWGKIFGVNNYATDSTGSQTPAPHSLEILPPAYIFPFSWAERSLRRTCWAGQPKFDAETCKDVLDVDGLGSYSISYFSHSWDGDPHFGDAR